MRRWRLFNIPGGWLTILILLGLGLRAYHYLRSPVVWHDEAALILNVLHKDFAEQFGKLYFSEASPPLFSCLEKVIVLGLGDSTFALRLLPFLASCGAFLLVVAVARRLLPAAAVFWVALLMGCSDRLLWHTCEAKPYAVDVLVAAGLLTLVPGKPRSFRIEQPEDEASRIQNRRLLLLALVSPLLVFLSFPACFLLGGAALALAPAVFRAHNRSTWTYFTLFLVLLCGSFVLLYLGPIRAQKDEHMVSCWDYLFPPWEQPWWVPVKAVMRFTELARYIVEPVGNLLVLPALVGGVWLWRTGQRQLLGFLLAPLGLVLVAWLGCQYPLGSVRVGIFAAPAILLLIATGLPPTLDWLRQRQRWLPLAVVVVTLCPVGQAGYRLVVFWHRFDSRNPVEFVLRQRQADEPVAGDLWEQAYYLRRLPSGSKLGPLFRALEPRTKATRTLLPTGDTGLPVTVRRLWLLSSPSEDYHRNYLLSLGPKGTWQVVGRYPFQDVTVLCLNRNAGEASSQK